MDFTLVKYRKLLSVLKYKYRFLQFRNLFENSNPFKEPIVIIRHDVDRKPENSLRTALIESELGVTGSYYFRIVPESFNEDIIKKIKSLGHEIGYHYEEISNCAANNGKNNSENLIDQAYKQFCVNLKRMRELADVQTICMHGSPYSKFDNRLVWEKYNYRDLKILGEPYFDIDWKQFGYLTDTGRRWNGDSVSLRDRVDSVHKFNFKTSDDLIQNIDNLPNKVMLNVHPERWTDQRIAWAQQLVIQNLKNIVKRYLLVRMMKNKIKFSS